MASFNLHDNQIRHNLRVIDLIRHTDNPPNDWIVTVYFYAAVHLIERSLSVQNVHSSSHEQRNETVRSVLFRDIEKQYESLYIESRHARYSCKQIKKSKVDQAKKWYDIIEKFVETQTRNNQIQ